MKTAVGEEGHSEMPFTIMVSSPAVTVYCREHLGQWNSKANRCYRTSLAGSETNQGNVF